MKIRSLTFLISFCCCILGMRAQTVDLSPTPQSVKWGNVTFKHNYSLNIKGLKTADPDAIALLKAHFTTSNKGIKVYIGERNDKAVKDFASYIPDHQEGYYLSVTPEQIVIAGNDAAGTYYGVQTFIQLASHGKLTSVTITDYPDVPERGVVEGFYGNPWSHQDRLSQFEFYGKNKMNVYIYGPKDDPYHRHQWREPYPEAEGKLIQELASNAASHKVNFVWAMHPGIDIQWNEEDRQHSLDKLNSMYALGVRAFAIFFDDIFGAEQARADKQAEYLNFLQQEFVEKHPDVAPLIMCPTEYNRGWAGKTYLPTLGKAMNPAVRIMWTGNSVVDMIDEADMDWINERIQRNAYIWLNYPVNDYCIDRLLMGPTYGNDKHIASQLSGFLSNPMEYAEASKLSLYSIADYTWNMKAYDEQASWEKAIPTLMPQHVDAFRTFCEHNIDLGATGHGLRRQGESAHFKQLAEQFEAALTQQYDQALGQALLSEFNKIEAAANELLADDSAPALSAEIAPWVRVMRSVAQRGQTVMKMYENLQAGQKEAFISNYEQLLRLEQTQKTIISRNFEGSIKKPNPTVGGDVLVPFIKRNTQTLIREYKAHYDYRTDIFPTELLEEGRYYIKCNGLWLTDEHANPDRVGDYPVWKKDEDIINPQRQEWIISMDLNTGRYKIVNAQDGRYINERGTFWGNKTNNPYNPAWHSFSLYRMNGKYAIQNGGNGGNHFWSEGEGRIMISDESKLHYDLFIFELIPVEKKDQKYPLIEEGKNYYIIDKAGNRLTNTQVKGEGGAPIFQAATEGTAQQWQFTLSTETGRFNLRSTADGRYINEIGQFGTYPYNPLWNTYILLEKGDLFSIRNAGNGGNDYWLIEGNQLNKGNIPAEESFQFSIVPCK